MVSKVYSQTDNQSKFIVCEEQVMIHLMTKQLLLGLHSAKIQIFKTLPPATTKQGFQKMQFSDTTLYSATQNAV
jgi:hypothetical protein